MKESFWVGSYDLQPTNTNFEDRKNSFSEDFLSQNTNDNNIFAKKWQQELVSFNNRLSDNELINEWKRSMNNLSRDIEYKNTTPEWRNFLDAYWYLFAADYMDAIEDALRMGLQNEELAMVLEWKYQNITNFSLDRQEKILEIVSVLKEKWELDFVDINRLDDFSDANLSQFQGTVFENNEKESLNRVIEIAKWELGTSEKTGAANKYFREMWMRNSAQNTPWCAAFINWCLKEAGLPGANSNIAKSFVNLTGTGHAGIKTEPGRMINGNWGNKVAMSGIPKFTVGYAIPTESGLVMKQWNFSDKEIPIGAIVVTGRNTRTRAGRMAT